MGHVVHDVHAPSRAGGLSPNPRPFFIYDARISYPEKADSIPAWVSVVVPFIFILTSLLVGECVLFKEVWPCVQLEHCDLSLDVAHTVSER